MDGVVPLLFGMAAGVVLAASGFLGWIYEPETIPARSQVREHLQGMRALVSVIRTRSDALAQMLDAVRRGR